jgi:hypothetical protein
MQWQNHEIACIKGGLCRAHFNMLHSRVSINDLECEMQKITPISHNDLKEYLFFLVDYRIISYHGQRQVYTIEHDGYDLLDVIMKEKRMMRADMDDLVVTLEKDC